ncbi:MAG: 23S rRNA (adenine(2030)-N(6))-methyltransferase RlmJ [Bermanella sp.]
MLSYRHGFHAGNHADVLKHWLCVLTAQYMTQKDKPFLYVDTHAAAGVYSLKSSIANKTSEFEGGIQAIWHKDTPSVMAPYTDLIKQLNGSDKLRLYPGSPWFVNACLRPTDKARLFELHPQDCVLLKNNFKEKRNIKVEKQDGFAGLKALLPPPSKRAMVVIDPPYEQAQEYKQVVASVKDSLKRFSSGVYIVWYPLINRRKSLTDSKKDMAQTMVRQLSLAGGKSFLDVRFWVNGKDEEEGMYGSGLAVINPPWNLAKQLEEGLPFLVESLGKTAQAGYSVDCHGS